MTDRSLRPSHVLFIPLGGLPIKINSLSNAAHRAALMRRPVKRSVVTDTAILFLVRFALIRTHYEPAFGPVHIRFRRGMLLSTTRTSLLS